MNNTISGTILAGGKNVRMNGINKAFIQINNVAIIQRTINIFKELFNESFVVTNSPDEFKLYKNDISIITDVIKNVGPLGGIYSALANTSKESVFIVGCDMPFLNKELIQNQIDCFNKLNCDILIPTMDSLIEPLHGIYKKTIQDKLYYFLYNTYDYSIKNFLRMVNVKYMDIIESKDIFKNVNTPEDVKNATKD